MARHEESNLQQACVLWFRVQYPEYIKLLFSVPNGARLAGTPKQRKIQMGILKKEGLTEGVSDLVLSLPTAETGVLYIEMKAEKFTKTGKRSRSQSRQSPAQKDFQKAVESVGYQYVLIDNFDDFRITVERHVLRHLQFQTYKYE